MDTLVLKLLLTPGLIAAASLAGRRWGPAVGGWLVGLPLTSGPIAFFLALSHGEAFAAATASGTLAGGISEGVFSLAYGWTALRRGWPTSFAAGCLAFAASTVALRPLALPPVPLFLVVVAALLLALRLMPRGGEDAPAPADAPPRWDIPARMAVATGLVLLLTASAPALGPQLTGLLAPFPLYAAILAIFAHHLQGPEPAIRLLRGLLLGLFAFSAFFLVLAVLIRQAGTGPAFAGAVAVSLAVQGASLWALRRTSRLAHAGSKMKEGSHLAG